MIQYDFLKDFGVDIKDSKNKLLLALALISVNNGISLGEAGKKIYNDPTIFHKLSKEIDELARKDYFKIEENDSKTKKYKCNFDKIAEDIINKNQEAAKSKESWWSKLFKGEYREYDYLIEFWKEDQIKKVFFDQKLILTKLNNLSYKFLLNSFCHFMELPLFIMVYSQFMDEISEEKDTMKTNIIYQLFGIQEYVLKLKELEKDLFYILHDEEKKELFEDVIDLHEQFYSKGKKVFNTISSDLPPIHTQLDFISELYEDEEDED